MFKQTIRRKIFFNIFSLSLLSLITISLAVYFLFFQTLKNNETKYAIQESDKTKQNMEFIINLIYDAGTSLASNKDLLDELNKHQSLSSNSYKDGQNRISTMLQNVISLQEYVQGIYVLGPNGNFYSNNWGVNEKDLKSMYGSYLKNESAQDYFTGLHSVSYYPTLMSSVISYIRPIYDITTHKIVGLIVIDLNYDLIKESFTISSIQNDEKDFIINSKGDYIFVYPYNITMDEILQDNPVLLKQDKVQLYTKVFGDDSIVVSNTIDYTDWRIIRVISSSRIHHDTVYLETIAIYVFAVFLLITLFISFLLSAKLTKPIKELNLKFKQLEKGDMNASIEIKGKDEMAELGNSFNNMVIKLKLLISTLLDEQKKKSDMEFQILQAQINPHFLYNTLDSIKWLAVIQNVHTISDMTNALINLLKYNISKHSTTVTLAEEVESVVNYVKIQKYRYGDIFNVDYNIEEEVRGYSILRFILQPIVENAILHGFENIEDTGIITLNARLQDELLIIEVIDNGVGMDLDTLESVNGNKIKKSKFSGIGVQNIQDRIKTYFGDEFGLFYESRLNLGTKVTVKLPAIIPSMPENAGSGKR